MDQIKIGKWIAELRRREGLTQEALGERIGVTNKTISRWENGNYMPDIETFGLLADIFGISIEELLDGAERADKVTRKAVKKKNTALDAGIYSLEEKKSVLYQKVAQRTHFIVCYSVCHSGCCNDYSIPVPKTGMVGAGADNTVYRIRISE